MDPCQPNPGQASPPPGCALESAILITLNPGAYTVHLNGDGGSGIGLVEIVAAGTSSISQLVNISTRSPVGTRDNVAIGGLIIDGAGPKTVLVRGRGPSMAGAPFFVSGVLSDPFLRLFSGPTLIAQNDNWQDVPSCSGFACGGSLEITATGLDPCQPNPGQASSPAACSLESAILITLSPGAYTVHLSGVGGQSGIGLIEVFQVHN